MVKCEYCLNFDGEYCTFYNKPIENPKKDRKCSKYIDIGCVGTMF